MEYIWYMVYARVVSSRPIIYPISTLCIKSVALKIIALFVALLHYYFLMSVLRAASSNGRQACLAAMPTILPWRSLVKQNDDNDGGVEICGFTCTNSDWWINQILSIFMCNWLWLWLHFGDTSVSLRLPKGPDGLLKRFGSGPYPRGVRTVGQPPPGDKRSLSADCSSADILNIVRVWNKINKIEYTLNMCIRALTTK